MTSNVQHSIRSRWRGAEHLPPKSSEESAGSSVSRDEGLGRSHNAAGGAKREAGRPRIESAHF